ncbi:hypothetical protein [Microbacterium thalli]|uniref:Uncharacterized protein n=1 Tax=Microbacterium thalli TaxID=3027921 RepID=A0ABT5SJ07_9MICO|nr:hypothetical protein [Microbacterium thalli]MDD7962042.1 hypothetical protein [Microbacterium thalli]MDN8549740.1 hypothetical protein [Microbacterium thalli]
MSTRTVRLAGDDTAVVAVARAARDAIAVDRNLSNRLVPAVMRLARDRQAFIAVPPDAAESRPSPKATGSASGDSSREVWPWILGVGLLAVSASASMFLPPVRGVVVEVEIALPIVVVATALAVVLLPVAALLARRARTYPAYVGMVISAIVATILAAMAVYRMIVGTASRGVPFSEEQLRLWFIAAGVMLIELVVLIVVLRRRHAAGAVRARPRAIVAGRRRTDIELRREAARLASMTPRTAADAAAVERHWLDAIAAIAPPPETLEQARRLGPVAWFVWTHFDGDIDVAALRGG